MSTSLNDSNLDDTQPLIVAEFTQNLTQKVDETLDFNILSLNRKKPVAELRVCSDEAVKFPVFAGKNLIGRESSCQIRFMNNSVVSKVHARIEIVDDAHFIIDCNSLNKTKRKTLVLIPERYYELNDGVVLTFADVECIYSFCSNRSPPQQDVPPLKNISVLNIFANYLPKTQENEAVNKISGSESPDLLSQELELDDDDDFDTQMKEIAKSLAEDTPQVVESLRKLESRKIDDSLLDDRGVETTIVKESQSYHEFNSDHVDSFKLILDTQGDSDDDFESTKEKVTFVEDDQLRSILHGDVQGLSDEALFGETAPFVDGTPIDVREMRRKKILAALELKTTTPVESNSKLSMRKTTRKPKKKKEEKTNEMEKVSLNAESKKGAKRQSSISKANESKEKKKTEKVDNEKKKRENGKKKAKEECEIEKVNETKSRRSSERKVATKQVQGEETTLKKNETKTEEVEKKVQVEREGTGSSVEEASKSKRRSRKSAKNEKVENEVFKAECSNKEKLETFVKEKTPPVEKKRLTRSPIKPNTSARKSNVPKTVEAVETPKTSQPRGRKRKIVDTNEEGIVVQEVDVEMSSPKKSKLEKNSLKIAFTGINDKELVQLTKIVTQLGAVVEDSGEHCTHLVAESIKRTAKFLCAVARGVPIVSPNWLKTSKTRNRLVSDCDEYLLSDEAAEEKFEFKLKLTLKKAKSSPLLAGYSFFVTPSVRPEPSQMNAIISCAGGKVMPKMAATERTSKNTIVVTCNEDRKMFGDKFNFHLVSSEFVLSGLLQYKLDVEKFRFEL